MISDNTGADLSLHVRRDSKYRQDMQLADKMSVFGISIGNLTVAGNVDHHFALDSGVLTAPISHLLHSFLFVLHSISAS